MLRQLRAVTLQWYVTREFLMLFTLTLLATSVLMLLLLAFQLVFDFDHLGISLGQVLLLSPFILPHALVQALPPSAMIASIMVFGRMSAENEILAAQAGGAPLRIMAIPLLLCGAIISYGSLELQDSGVRWGNTTIRDKILKINQPEFFTNIDKPNSSIGIQPDLNTTVRINLLPLKDGLDGRKLRPIQIIYFQNGKQGKTVFAEDHEFTPAPKGENSLIVDLMDVQMYGERTLYSDKITIAVARPDVVSLISIGNTRGQKSWAENRDIAERIVRDEPLRWKYMLRRASDFGALAAAGSIMDGSTTGLVVNGWNETRQHVDSIVANGGALERMKLENTEFHRKVALSMLPFAMILLGMGLGLLVKKSNRMIGFLSGVAIYCMLYIPLTVIAKSMSNTPSLGKYAWTTQHMPNVLFLIMGMVLWVGHERGHITGLPHFLRPSSYINMGKVAGYFRGLWGVILKIIALPVRLFWRTTDRYIAATFLAPLVVVVFSIAGFIIAFDAIEHHNDLVDGVKFCAEPIGNLAKRTQWEAIGDIGIYYLIQGLETTLDILPLEILLAGMLCAMVLVRNQEHLILKSSGVRLQRALLPVMFLAVFVSLGVSAVREFFMPTLVVKRDRLKPLVYHRTPQTSAFALYTFDEKKKPLLFAVSAYESITKTGRDLRVYLLGDQKNKRIPIISADFIKWDGKAWELWTDPAVQEQALVSQKSLGSSKEPKPKPELGKVVPELKRGGVYSVTESLVMPGPAASSEVDSKILRETKVIKSTMNSWPGTVDPKFIDSERLGARVMRLAELDTLSEYKPALKVDWFRRLSEFLMGLFLLACAMPLLFNDNTGSPVKAIIMTVAFGAVYWGLVEYMSSLARNAAGPPWIPLLPHAAFFLIGIVQYFKRLQT